MAQQVIKTFDYYNTLTLLPGYTVPGYEDEQSIAKAEYSTDFSSNPIGSKIDFYNHLNDPCLGIQDPNPVFTIPKSLSALNPQWFNGWWDNAMFYSHPLITDQLKLDNPQIYQDFSDSVGTLVYVPTAEDPNDPAYGNDAISPAVTGAGKIPNNLLNQINSLNSSVLNKFNGFTPTGLGPLKGTFLNQVKAFKTGAASLQNAIPGKVGALKNKLPFSVNLTGNLVTPTNWNHSINIEGVNSVVNKAGNIIKAPGRMLSSALVKIQNLIPKISLPSISKLVGAYAPNMPVSSGIISGIQSASTGIKSALSTAQGAMAAVAQTTQGVIAAGSTLANATNNLSTQAGQGLSIVNTSASIVQNVNKVNTVNGVTSALTKQTDSAVSTLNNNKIVILGSNPNKQGNIPVQSLNTFSVP